MDVDAVIGQRIAVARRRRGWMQRDLADRVGRSESWISQVERGVHSVDSMRTAEALAEVLGCTVAHILAFDIRYPTASGEEKGMSRRQAMPYLGLPIVATDGIAALLDKAANEALEFTRQAESGALGSNTIDHLQIAIIEFDTAYAVKKPATLFPLILDYRRRVAKLLQAPRTLRQTRDLYVCAGWLSELLAWLADDLGHPRAGAAFAADAFTHAVEADHGELVAWAMDAAASIAMYRKQPKRALAYARRGGHHAPADHPLAVRMHAQAARALAASGDKDGYQQEMTEANRVFDTLPARASSRFDLDTYPLAEYALTSYPATACIMLGESDRGRRHAEEALAIYAAAAPEARSPSREAIARIDLALAHAQLGDSSTAVSLGTEALSGDRVVDSVRVRAGDLAAYLTTRWAAHADVAEFRELVAMIGTPHQ